MPLTTAVIYVLVTLVWHVFITTHTCWKTNSMTHIKQSNSVWYTSTQHATKAPGARLGCFFLITRLVALGSQSQNPN